MGLELAKMWVRVRADDTGMQQDLAKTKSRLVATGAAISAAAMGWTGTAIALGTALGVGAAGSRGLGLAADLETTTIAFETMLGSAAAAKKMLDDLTQFASATPFELPQIQQATKILLGFGVAQDKIMPTLRTLGDISAGTGKDFGELAIIFGQVKAKGRLMGGELLQFSEASVPLLAVLEKQMKKNTATIIKMTEQGKISFADVEKALKSMSDEGGIFFNLMERQSQTVIGLWSTLKDAVDKELRGLFTALEPTTRAVLRTAIVMTEAFGSAVETIKINMQLVSGTIYDALADIAATWKSKWQLMINDLAIQLTKGYHFVQNWLALLQKLMLNPTSAFVINLEEALRIPDGALKVLEDEQKRLLEEWHNEITKFRGLPFGGQLGANGEPAPIIPPQQPPTVNPFEEMRGRVGFAELGRKMQDTLMKKTDDNQLKMIALMEAGNAKQDELIKAVRDKPVAQVGLQ